jgi:hypothetical protein
MPGKTRPRGERTGVPITAITTTLATSPADAATRSAPRSCAATRAATPGARGAAGAATFRPPVGVVAGGRSLRSWTWGDVAVSLVCRPEPCRGVSMISVMAAVLTLRPTVEDERGAPSSRRAQVSHKTRYRLPRRRPLGIESSFGRTRRHFDRPRQARKPCGSSAAPPRRGTPLSRGPGAARRAPAASSSGRWPRVSPVSTQDCPSRRFLRASTPGRGH